MNDRPSASELLEAVEQFLETEVVPALSGKLKYNARVAAHVVGSVRRELACDDEHLQGEWQRLDGLEGRPLPLPGTQAGLRDGIRERTEALVERIRAGEADAGAFREAVVAHLRETVADKLEVARGRRPGATRMERTTRIE